jgi:hypothetical protein
VKYLLHLFLLPLHIAAVLMIAVIAITMVVCFKVLFLLMLDVLKF